MIKPRKKFPSDSKATLRVSPALHSKIRAAAAKDSRTIEAFVDLAMSFALEPKK